MEKLPDKNKQPFTYHMWKERGMLKMTPAERVLMQKLSEISALQSLLFGDSQWWDNKDMQEFVKHIVPKILSASKST